MQLPISPYFDRFNTDQVKLSINFIDFIVQPLFASVVKLFPELECCSKWLKDSRGYWLQFAEADPMQQTKDKLIKRKRAGSFVVRDSNHATDQVRRNTYALICRQITIPLY